MKLAVFFCVLCFSHALERVRPFCLTGCLIVVFYFTTLLNF